MEEQRQPGGQRADSLRAANIDAHTDPYRSLYATAFWICAVLGIAVMYFAWWSLALASLEEGTELPKAIAAGADHTVRGTTLLFGVLPLLAAHAIGLALLCLFARRWLQRPQAPWWGVLAVAVDSVIGFVLVLAITGGELLYTSH